MKRSLLLATVMAALVLLASASSFALIGEATDNTDVSFGEPVLDSPIAEGANPTQSDRDQLAITASNLDTLGQQAQTATTPEQIETVRENVVNETNIMNTYLTKREIIVQELTPAQLVSLLKGLGYWGGATWGRGEVDRALREKLLFGRSDGVTSSSDEWRQWLTREEFAVGMMRTLDQAKAYAKGYTDDAIADHNNNPYAHSAMQRAIDARIREAVSPLWILMWIILGLIALSLLGWLLWWLICGRHRCHGGGYATTGVVPPVVPGAGATTPLAGFGPAMRNNAGIQHIP